MAEWYDKTENIWEPEKKTALTTAPIGSNTPAPAPAPTTEQTPKSYYNQGMTAIGQLATGDHPIYKSTENRYTQQFGGAALAAIGSAKQETAQAGGSKEAIGSTAQRVMTNLEGERSKAIGDIAAAKQSIAGTAAGQLVSGGIQGQQMDIAQSQADQAKNQAEWERMLTVYDPSTPEGAKALQSGYTSMFGGTTPDLAMIKEQRDYLKQKQQQDIETGAIGITSSKEAAKRAEEAMYGYDVTDENGNNIGRVKGTLELQNDSLSIEKQGMDLNEAQIKGYIDNSGNYIKGSIQINAEKLGMEASSLYGYAYNSETGEIVTDAGEIAKLGSKAVRVDGALVLAQKQYGLQEGSFEMQYAEMYGKDYKTGNAITDESGNKIKGRIEILSSEDKRSADQLYGYTETLTDGTEVKHSGTLQVMEDELAIKKQGLSIQEAQYFGYKKEDGTYVQGTLEIESRKAELLEKEYESQQASTAGVALSSHFALMKNTTGYVWQNDAQAQNLLQSYWEAIPGNEGTEYDEEWAQRQYQASTISETDAAIAGIEGSKWYKELLKTDKAQAEQVMKIAKVSAVLSVTGGMTPVYGDNGEIVAIQDTEGNQINISGTAATTTKAALSSFQKTVTEGVNITEEMWNKAGKPKTYDKYLEKSSPVLKVDELGIESTSELLTQNNSKVLFDALKKDEKAVKDSEYYYEMMSNEDIKKQSSFEHSTMLRAGETSVTDSFKSTISNNAGKITTFTGFDGKSYTGQLVRYELGPSSVSIVIKDKNGKETSVKVVDHRS
jgi:hypothetical protein